MNDDAIDNPALSLPPFGLAMDSSSVSGSFLNHLQHTRGKHPKAATLLDRYFSLARTARDRMYDRWTRTWQHNVREQPKRVYYMSMEFLLGRLLEDGLWNLGIHGATREAIAELGLDFAEIVDQEHDAGLGNGGLGRLAACFLDSMATLGIAGVGYGIRYEYGIFRQRLVAGAQVEAPDNWLHYGNPWEVARPEIAYRIEFGGRVIEYTDQSGRTKHEWVDTNDVVAMAYDIPVPGYGNEVVNTLRLWSAKASKEFDISYFNQGDYIKAVQEKSQSENISRVLYPNDNQLAGKELRLKQGYFLVSATLQDSIRRHLSLNPSLDNLHERAVFQMNDTHPALAVTEMMRLLLDTHGYEWDAAWQITRQCFAYTNHTILPEALERWPVWLLERVLPRHLQLIYEINQRFLSEVRERYPGDDARARRMSLIEEGPEKQARMAHLAIVGSKRVNGVSALHTRIIREQLFRDFEDFYPDKFINQTNGVTPRRWLKKCNPGLAGLLDARLGGGWVTDLEQLRGLEAHADDAELQRAFAAIKLANKQRLERHLDKHFGLRLDPAHILDVQVKRIHEYKRQLLNILHVVALGRRIQAGRATLRTPVSFVFSGKAAPGYDAAKRIIALIGAVSDSLARDAELSRQLSVLFVPNYSVTLAEVIIPASDVSEQISTAGMEASGTGNMKFALNAALTLGTLDGANIEIREAVGAENFFSFGLTAEQVEQLRERGHDREAIYYSDPDLRGALDAVASGAYSPDDPSRFRGLVDDLIRRDPYFVLSDFKSYTQCREGVFAAYADPAAWQRRCILNVARMGRFSSDRAIMGYTRDIWQAEARTPPESR